MTFVRWFVRSFVLQEEKEKEEMAGANKISDPRKKGSKDDKSKKGKLCVYHVVFNSKVK